MSKSSKSKEKKQKRKEETERTNKLWQLVEEANKAKDPLEPFISFQKYQRNGLKVGLRCCRSTDMEKELMDWAFELTKTNMEEEYEDNWGWNDKEKLRELKDDRMWFLVARDEEKPVAFVSFRFDLDFNQPVLYCYEIQLTATVQRKGLGKFMMQILQLMAMKYKMQKVVATVLHSNNASKNFFIQTLRYTTDETSPIDECYEIISKEVRQRS